LKIESESPGRGLLRSQERTSTGRNCLVRSRLPVFSNNNSRGVWLPAPVRMGKDDAPRGPADYATKTADLSARRSCAC